MTDFTLTVLRPDGSISAEFDERRREQTHADWDYAQKHFSVKPSRLDDASVSIKHPDATKGGPTDDAQ